MSESEWINRKRWPRLKICVIQKKKKKKKKKNYSIFKKKKINLQKQNYFLNILLF